MRVGRLRREQLVSRARQFGVARERGFAQCGGGRVQQAVGQGVGQEVEDFLGIAAVGELLPRFGEDFIARGIAVRAQALQRLLARAGMQVLDVARDRQFDDGFGLVRGFEATAAVVFDGALQVVDGIEIGVIQFGNRRLNVARHGQVEQQHRLVPAQ